jgi:hypothetical protein
MPNLCSSAFLLLLNSIFAAFGLIMIIAGAYGYAFLERFSTIINVEGLAGLLSLGVFVFLFSLLGVVGVVRKSRCLLYVYVLATTLCLVAEIGAGAFVVMYANRFTAVAAESTSCDNATAMGKACVYADAANHELHTYIDCSFYQCCAKDNATVVFDGNFTQCESNTFKLNAEACTALKLVNFRGRKLINCGETQQAYRTDFYAFFVDNVMVVGVLCVVFAVIQLLAMVGACFIIKNAGEKGEFDQGEGHDAQL